MAKGQATTMFQVPKVEEEGGGGGRGSIGRGIDDVQLWQVTEKAGPIYQSSTV